MEPVSVMQSGFTASEIVKQYELFGMGMSMLRLASASIDRTRQTEEMEQMDEKGKAFSTMLRAVFL